MQQPLFPQLTSCGNWAADVLRDNPFLEQLILYPSLVGNAIGLTTLETIIVVLLGAIFAGITGMILAIPAAAVLKYLVPQIYHCLDRSDRKEREMQS